jgi:hypothetical protein
VEKKQQTQNRRDLIKAATREELIQEERERA